VVTLFIVRYAAWMGSQAVSPQDCGIFSAGSRAEGIVFVIVVTNGRCPGVGLRETELHWPT